MASNQDYVLAPTRLDIAFAVDPAIYALSSLLAVGIHKKFSGLSPWVTRTHGAMTPSQRRSNGLVVDYLFEAVRTRRAWERFEDYLGHLERADAEAMRDCAVEQLAHTHEQRLAGQPPTPPETFLNSYEAFLAHYKSSKKHASVSNVVLKALYELLMDPTALRRTAVAHIGAMWAQFLERDWRRHAELLNTTVEAFGQIDFSNATLDEAVRKVMGRELRMTKAGEFAGVRHLTFLPSPHIGPYALKFRDGDLVRLVFGARLPEGATGGPSALNRSDLLIKLSALVDETRLHILELLVRYGELSAQSVMEALDQSQSSVSRHLIQLHSSGFLDVRKEARGKKLYRLNRDRIQQLLKALDNFLLPR